MVKIYISTWVLLMNTSKIMMIIKMMRNKKYKKAKVKLNADGFGISWYEHSISNKPALFKSIFIYWH